MNLGEALNKNVDIYPPLSYLGFRRMDIEVSSLLEEYMAKLNRVMRILKI